MHINFGTNYSRCSIIFDLNGNYGINNANMLITSYSNWNGIVHFPNGITCASVNAYVTEIGSNAFNSSVLFPNSVTSLGHCFSNRCMFNKIVTIPNSVTNASSMFRSCANFDQNIQIPNSVTNAAVMFNNCANFNQPITIPNSVTNTSYMFSGCPNFNQPITIPNSVTNTSYMFSGCSNFNQPIAIPNSVTNGVFMFKNCNMLCDITIAPDIRNNAFMGFLSTFNEHARNIWTDPTTAANLITTKIIHPTNTNTKNAAQILPTWDVIDNGYYNALYNVYIYTNTVFPS